MKVVVHIYLSVTKNSDNSKKQHQQKKLNRKKNNLN